MASAKDCRCHLWYLGSHRAMKLHGVSIATKGETLGMDTGELPEQATKRMLDVATQIPAAS